MKSLNAKLLALAGTLAIAATQASAQVVLKASVPFSFQAGVSGVMPSGDYQIRHDGYKWTFTKIDSRVQALTQSTTEVQGKATDTPHLVFQCRANHCTLSRVVPGAGEPGGYWRAPKPSKADAGELAQIVVVPASVAR